MPGVPDLFRLVRRSRPEPCYHPGVRCLLYIETRQQTHLASDVKQQLAAVRMLFDRLIIGQVVPTNPASAVLGPTHVVKTDKTPVLEAAEWRRLLDSIPTVTA